MTNKWDSQFYLLKVSVVLGLLLGYVFIRYLRLPIVLVGVILLFLGLLLYDRLEALRQGGRRVFPVSLDEARRIVQNVLNEKGMPFKEIGDLIFVIEDEVEIHLLPAKRGRTAVNLIPKNKGSDPLIQSLRQKLDEAFQPRGLS